nr:alanine racemase [Angustibacter aerolatus]
MTSTPATPPAPPTSLPAQAQVDLDALRSNVAALDARSGSAQVMAVVKADAYGHGLLPCARAAREGGASWLGVAQHEALTLRRGGDQGRLLSWLHVPGDDFAAALTGDVDLSVSDHWALDEIAAAARATDRVARVHLKIDTGLSRGGVTADGWADLVGAALRLQAEGCCASSACGRTWCGPTSPTTRRPPGSLVAFREAVAVAERLGADLEVRHLANSAATLTTPAAHFDLVRPGIAVYGLSPVPQARRPGRLRPAAGDDAARAGGAGEAGAGRHRRVVRPPVHDRARHDAGAGAAGVRRRAAAGCVERRAAARRGSPHPGRRPGLHGPGGRRPRRAARPGRGAGRRRRRGVRRRDPWRADRAGVGRRGGHHRLRDRDAGRCPGAAHLPRGQGVSQRRGLLGLGAGVAAAGVGAALGVAAQRWTSSRGVVPDLQEAYGSLRGEPVRVVASDGAQAVRRGRRARPRAWPATPSSRWCSATASG